MVSDPIISCNKKAQLTFPTFFVDVLLMLVTLADIVELQARTCPVQGQALETRDLSASVFDSSYDVPDPSKLLYSPG
jgi:hypothetical protein